MDRGINLEHIQEQKKTAQADSVKAISQAEDWKESYEAVNIKKQELEKQLAELKNQQKEELIKHIDSLSNKIDKIKIPENKGQSNEQVSQLKVQIRKLEQDKADLQSLLRNKTELKRRFKQNEYLHYSQVTAFFLTVLLFTKAPIRADFLRTWNKIKDIFYNFFFNLLKQPSNKFFAFLCHWFFPSIATIFIVGAILWLLAKLHADFTSVYEAEQQAKKVHLYSVYNIVMILIMIIAPLITAITLNTFLLWLIAWLIDVIYLAYQVKINTED